MKRMLLQETRVSRIATFSKITSFSRRTRMIRATVKLMDRAMTVATAAPATPQAGKGPMPKINNGSRMVFTRADISITRLGVLASPVARMALLPTWGTTTAREPKYQIRM